MKDRRYILLEDGYPHTVLMLKEEAEAMKQKWQMIFPHLKYTIIYDEYYEYIEFYSEEEKEQINRLIP